MITQFITITGLNHSLGLLKTLFINWLTLNSKVTIIHRKDNFQEPLGKKNKPYYRRHFNFCVFFFSQLELVLKIIKKGAKCLEIKTESLNYF